VILYSFEELNNSICSTLGTHENEASMSAWPQFLASKPVDAMLELGAYEHLWQQPKASTKTLAKLFAEHPGQLPSELVEDAAARVAYNAVLEAFERKGITDFGVRINGTFDYPDRLRDAADPVELLYYQGSWDLAEAPRRVAVVGTRKVSSDGVKRTKKLVRLLVQNDHTIVSGLAEGVDTLAHETAITHGGRTIAVIGTPISENYPKQNIELQRSIADRYLLISQVPVLRYMNQKFWMNRFFFPERNKTMSALTEATIIVEASNTSGTLIQAQAALDQGRKLFILESNFHNSEITWPAKFEKLGAVRVGDFEAITDALSVH
jgi:DNA processing protein